MDVLIAGLVVAVISFVSGSFAIPIGFALGLDAFEVYFAAVAGSLAGLVVFLYAGESIRARIRGDRAPHEADPNSRIRQIGDRYGAEGLALVGPVFPGVTAAVVIGLSSGFERAAIARWMSIGIAAMFALYTFGLWLLVELVGVR